jgi:Zn-dependent M16 (insulinase) family peptidase
MKTFCSHTLSLVFKQVKEENLEALSKLVREELQRIVKEGFDKKLIEACINAKEFFLRKLKCNASPKVSFMCWVALVCGIMAEIPCPIWPLRDILRIYGAD